jgi:hypothetical protein
MMWYARLEAGMRKTRDFYEEGVQRCSRENVKGNTLKLKKTKLRGRSPQANYTDRGTAACRRS